MSAIGATAARQLLGRTGSIRFVRLQLTPGASNMTSMFSDEIIGVIADAIKSEIAHPIGQMRHLPVSEEVVALTVLNALDQAGFEIRPRGEQ